jgi:hypothetical protein
VARDRAWLARRRVVGTFIRHLQQHRRDMLAPNYLRLYQEKI